MPNYTETKASIITSAESVNAARVLIDREKDLTGGYRAVVRFNIKNAAVTVKMKGPHSNINRIPPVVVIKYAQVVNRVKRWLDDLEPDFPTL